MAGFGGIFGRLSSLFTAGAVGGAAADSIAPVLRLVEQHANERRAVRVVDPGTAADAAAQQLDTDLSFRSLDEAGNVVAGSTWRGSPVDFEDDAKRQAIGHERFRLLRGLRTRVPPYAEALTLWRRGRIDEETVDSVLAREGIPRGLWPALKELVGERLDPETIANAVQQGFVPDADLLPGPVSGPPYDIPVEQVPIETLREFKAAGVDPNRAKVLAELSGNPPAPDQLANMLLRKQIPPSGWDTGIREGRTKTKWSHALRYYLTHPLLSPSVEITRLLKGWQTKAETDARLSLYGYTPEQVQDWYEAEGRPAAPGQMATAAARGIDGPEGRPMDREQFLRGIRESDIRPEWGPMLWDSRFLYPPLFQLTRLVQGKAIDADTAREWARKDRYPPEVVDALHTYWLTLDGGTTGTHLPKAQTQLWNRLHSSYLAGEIVEDDARAELPFAGVTSAEIDDVLTTWGHERDVERKQLTAPQVKKAYTKGVQNPATGSPWTRDDALAALIGRGYSPADANTFLDL